MTKRKNYPRLRNGKLEGTGMPPHFIDEKKKEVVFHGNIYLDEIFPRSGNFVRT